MRDGAAAILPKRKRETSTRTGSRNGNNKKYFLFRKLHAVGAIMVLFSAWYIYSDNFPGQKGQETCSKLSGKPISAAHREGYVREEQLSVSPLLSRTPSPIAARKRNEISNGTVAKA